MKTSIKQARKIGMGILALGVLLFSAFALTSAQNETAQKVFNFYDGATYQEAGDADIEFSYGAASDPTTGFTVVNIEDSFTTGTGATVTFNGTTTPSFNTNFNVDNDIVFAATTTARALVTGLVTQENTGVNKLCYTPFIHVSTAMGIYGAQYTVGTTTLSNDSSMVATTTSGLLNTTIATSTASQFSAWDRTFPGSIDGGWATTTQPSYYEFHAYATGTPWLWRNGEYLVAAVDIGGATSTDTFDTGNFTGVATLKVNCFAQ